MMVPSTYIVATTYYSTQELIASWDLRHCNLMTTYHGFQTTYFLQHPYREGEVNSSFTTLVTTYQIT
jgi:hypothetical protein